MQLEIGLLGTSAEESNAMWHCLNAELGQFGTESLKTYADVLSTSHASRSQARL